jgi:2-oxoglutarate ferredoxin oxidoreductase subunit gamma
MVPMWHVEIRLAGAGGQGLGLAAVILAESALASGYEAAMMQTYGPEARGGASCADVVIAEGMIVHPRFEHPSMLLVMNPKAWNRFARLSTSQDTITLIDAQLVHPDHAVPGLIALPFEQIAREELREKITANMVAVGALGQLIRHIPLAVLEHTVELRSPKALRRPNREAINRGWHLVTTLLSGEE